MTPDLPDGADYEICWVDEFTGYARRDEIQNVHVATNVRVSWATPPEPRRWIGRPLSATGRAIARAGTALDRWAAPRPRHDDVKLLHAVDDPIDEDQSSTCGATDGRYGVCNLPAGHAERWHQEWRDGSIWAEWSR